MVRRITLAVLALLVPSAVRAQVPDDVRWVPNGPVYAVAQRDGITYIGGNFTVVSPATGGGVLVNLANDVIPAGYPYVVGRVFVSIPDGTGGWYIGGNFTSVGGQVRKNLARLASDGSLYPWSPAPDDEVYALALTNAGTIYVGFTQISGQARFRLAEIDVNTGGATALNIQMSSNVRAFALLGTTMYVGGDFSNAGGTGRSRLCAIDVPTRALTAWNPGANGSVLALEIGQRPGPSTTILVGGAFSTLGGQARANLGEVFTNGFMSSWNPSPNGTVRDILEHGTDYIVGDFTTVEGFPRNRAAAVDANGFLRPWNPDVSGPCYALAWSGGFVYIGGNFETVSGAGMRNAVKVDDVNGVPAGWMPNPNKLVYALALGATKIYVGGEFTGCGGVERRNLAAYDDWDGGVTEWSPDANGTVSALAVRAYGPVTYAVYAGGSFSSVHGVPRANVAALHPKTGEPTSWSANTDGPVLALGVNDSMVVMGGEFGIVDGTVATRLAVKRHDGGPAFPFTGGTTLPSTVLALATSGQGVYVGGFFGMATFTLFDRTQLSYQIPSVNGAVRAVHLNGGRIYIGGDFTTVQAQPRSRIARYLPGGSLEPWAPDADGIVRSIVLGETGMIVGGDFANIGGSARARLAQLDMGNGLAQSWAATVSDAEVWAIAASGPHTWIGGGFHGVGGFPLSGFAAVGPPRVAMCLPSPAGSFAGSRPTAITTLDADVDGHPDVAVCIAGTSPRVNVLKAAGDGTFLFQQSIATAWEPKDVISADFDIDGLPDLVVSESDDIGQVVLYHNVGGTFDPWTSVPMPGRIEGLDVGDFDADGILDLVVCQIDSASVIRKGGLEILKGGGANGVWNGTFTPILTPVWGRNSLARRVVAHDFNQDGWMDFVYTGPGAFNVYHGGPGGIPTCHEGLGITTPPGNTGVAIVLGDFNDDGRTDFAYPVGRNLRIRFKNTETGCLNWFQQNAGQTVVLPSVPRDIAAVDFDETGTIDLLCTLDSLNTVVMSMGLGITGNDGTFFEPFTFGSTHDLYDFAFGDFSSDGHIDYATTMQTCGQVGFEPSHQGTPWPGMLVLGSPNGGEEWSQSASLPPATETQVIAIPDEDAAFALAPAPVELDAAPPVRVQGTQLITWSKDGAVDGVDVELSRNDGATWQTIGRNLSGNSMNWIVTPPGTGLARVRVRDTSYRTRVDASDAPFTLFAGVVAVPETPRPSALRLLGRNPAAGPMKFALDVASPAEVAIVLYDAAGRRVRTLARGPYPAGSHDLAWDGTDERGADCRRGVYFVKSKIGPVESTRKVVML